MLNWDGKHCDSVIVFFIMGMLTWAVKVISIHQTLLVAGNPPTEVKWSSQSYQPLISKLSVFHYLKKAALFIVWDPWNLEFIPWLSGFQNGLISWRVTETLTIGGPVTFQSRLKLEKHQSIFVMFLYYAVMQKLLIVWNVWNFLINATILEQRNYKSHRHVRACFKVQSCFYFYICSKQ